MDGGPGVANQGDRHGRHRKKRIRGVRCADGWRLSATPYDASSHASASSQCAAGLGKVSECRRKRQCVWGISGRTDSKWVGGFSIRTVQEGGIWQSIAVANAGAGLVDNGHSPSPGFSLPCPFLPPFAAGEGQKAIQLPAHARARTKARGHRSISGAVPDDPLTSQ